MELLKVERKKIWANKSLSAKKRKKKMADLEAEFKSGKLAHLTNADPAILSSLPSTMLRNFAYGHIMSREKIYEQLNSPQEVLLYMNVFRLGGFIGGSVKKKGKAEHELLGEFKSLCLKELDTMGLTELNMVIESMGLTGVGFEGKDDLDFQMTMLDRHVEDVFKQVDSVK